MNIKRLIKTCLNSLGIVTTEIYIFYWFEGCVDGKRIITKTVDQSSF